MSFDVKGVFNSPAWSVAGGVLIGLAVFWLVLTTIDSLVRPLFNIVFERGVIVLSRNSGIEWNCGAFLSAVIIAVICVALGFVMIKSAGK